MPREVPTTKYRRSPKDKAVVRLMRDRYGITIEANKDEVVRDFRNDLGGMLSGAPRMKYRVAWKKPGFSAYHYRFYGSVHQYEKGTHPSMFDFVHAKVLDATFMESEGIGSARELADSMGDDYDDKPKRYNELFRELQDSYSRVVELLGSDDELYWFAARLDEMEDE